MGVDTRLAAAVLLLTIAPAVFTQERPSCTYMVQIPRPDTPVFPDQDFTGVTWSQRPLIPADSREDLCMDEWVVSVSTQVIFLEEEIEGEVTIARLNYQGTETPEIGAFLAGSLPNLGPVIRRVGNEWHLVVTQRQDFENPIMRDYMFRLNIPGETLSPLVSLEIVNIDDNPPIIEVFQACQVDELGEPRATDCVYTVRDADGQISTSVMSFRVESNRPSDEQIFVMKGANVENDWFTMTMTVHITEPLNFETNALHVFNVIATDSRPNHQTASMMIQVQNVEHRPPRWVNIFSVQQFDEKTVQQFPLQAIDGDTGIDKPIDYKLIKDPADDFFSLEVLPGGRSGAILHVDKIDRDTLMREVFQVTIVAFKYDNEAFSTAREVVIIVNDINDQWPLPLQTTPYTISIMEETPLTLNFATPFGFHDRDLGENAQYTVTLEDDYPPGAASAFQINPNVGYQQQTFIMSTVNHSMLDFEVPEFQTIRIKVIATDNNNTNFVGVATVEISLINWNDELPIFSESSYTASFKETVGKGFAVATIPATDRDIDDRVEHSLMGNAGEYLSIDKDSGAIIVSVDEAFDYHRQNVLFVQIRADDTLGEPYNTATTQLVIQLEDVNNTPPTLRLPRGSPSVEENVPDGYIITQEIHATDPDTTAKLVFEIDWDSTWATKQGRETPEEEFKNCVEIKTLYQNPEQLGTAYGQLVVREIRDGVTIDFEEFEVLYLTVRVRDLNTELQDDYDESTFTLRIIDMNDNMPLFDEGTLEQNLRVREVSASGVVIGSVLATDIDGPLYNRVRYTIVPRNDTPVGLVKIDFNNGQIAVDEDGAIDADVPPRQYLYYTVIASDRCYETDQSLCPPDPTYWETMEDIQIEILDTNNKVPEADYERFNVTVYVWENATTGDEVVQLYSSDLDRDEIYNTVRYQINYAVNARLRPFFSVDQDSGLVVVDYTTDEVLDRDGDEPKHTIFLNFIDNFHSEGDGRRNQYDTQVEVILLDVNDNAPEMPSPEELFWDNVSENLLEGVRLSPHIYAPDRDEPDTDNSRVGYRILALAVTDRPGLDVPDLFTMVQIQNITGELETALPLRGYWGTYQIHIEAFDHGHPQQFSDEVYRLTIQPYNFHSPVFQFPLHDSTIRLATELTTENGQLTTASGQFLDRIHATDEDGLHAGKVTFQVQGNEEATEYFNVVNSPDGDNTGTLVLLKTFPEEIREFRITIRATDGGTDPGPLSTDSAFTVIFVPSRGDPVFNMSSTPVAFIEGIAGMEQSFQLPQAEDIKNFACTDDCFNIYYRIIDGNNEGLFSLEPSTNVIRLVRELDREAAATHTIMVAASNSPDATNQPLQASILVVNINVREANPRPIFERELYTAGISTADSIGRELLTVKATHSEDATVTYTIDQASMQVDSSLEAVRESAFALNAATGALALNMQPTAAMHGMFDFLVLATDPANANDTTQVKVYLISSLNRVTFIFVNTLEEVEAHRDFIAQTFTAGFSMTCNIDEVVPHSDSNGVAREDVSEVRGHFIRGNVPVLATEIEELRSDTLLLRNIQHSLSANLLLLQDFVTDASPDGGADSATTTLYVLAALSALLAALCLVLLLTFFIRTRELNRRLQALSMTKYGSVDSGLNRVGLAPGTNKHAVEGSNPIWNEAIKAPDFDAISDLSGDSDLIGIEDLPQFREDYFPPADTNSATLIAVHPRGGDEGLATHENNFGFNTSPFSQDFTNKQFNR
uniref:Cadherin n=1 Tax=Cnaphalocrocis medinalis TaxID=437488 RepID=A0A7H1D3E8_CNAME|nr:cadherin [Cnaphalocrocis medinalis]